MLDKALSAIEPFALTVIFLAGASLAGYVKFTNGKMVGEATIFFAVLLIIKHVVGRITEKHDAQPIKVKKG